MLKQTRFGVQIVSFNDSGFLESVIRLFQPFVDKIVVSLNSRSWLGNIPNDGSVEKIVNRISKECDNVHLLKGDWNTEEEQRNFTLSSMAECDFVFITDDDELWSTDSIHKVMDYVISPVGKSYTVFNSHWNTRFKNLQYLIAPQEPFKPTVLINNKVGLKFEKNRAIKTDINSVTNLLDEKLVVIEHMSYVRSDDLKIKEKIQTFSHANEIINSPQWWYENVYLQADLNSTNLHPVVPECYASLIEHPIDVEILATLKRFSPQFFNEK